MSTLESNRKPERARVSRNEPDRERARVSRNEPDRERARVSFTEKLTSPLSTSHQSDNKREIG